MKKQPTKKEIEKVLSFLWLRGIISQKDYIQLGLKANSYVNK